MLRLPVACLALVLAASCTTQTVSTTTTGTPTSGTPAMAAAPVATTDADLLALVNSYRASQGLPALRSASALNNAALAHARDMTSRGFFGHTGSNGSTVGARVRNAGCSWTQVAENIATGQPTPNAAMSTWLNSPGHRRNITGPYSQMGQARVGNTWVTVFASGC